MSDRLIAWMFHTSLFLLLHVIVRFYTAALTLCMCRCFNSNLCSHGDRLMACISSYVLCFLLQVFRPDGTNGFDVFTEAEARVEQQHNMPKKVSARVRSVQTSEGVVFQYMTVTGTYELEFAFCSSSHGLQCEKLGPQLWTETRI